MDISDRLEVRLWSAATLPLVDGAPPSTFGEIVVGTDTKRTGVMSETKNPKWESDPLIFTDILSQGAEAVLIFIKHVCQDGSEKPLGVVVIPTDGPFASPRMELDGTYDLMPTTGMDVDEHGVQAVQGSVRVRMTYFSTMDPSLLMNSLNILESKPNMLNVTVIDGSNVGSRYKGGIDAVVTIQIGEMKASTKVAKRSNDPEWNEKISIPVEDGAQLVEIQLVHSSLVRNLFMGRTRIPLNEIADTSNTGLTRSFALFDQNLQFSESQHFGKIQLQLAWVYNQSMADEKAAKQKRSKWFKRMGRVAGAVGGVASFLGGGVAYVSGGVASGAGAALGIAGGPDKGAKFKKSGKKKGGAAGDGEDEEEGLLDGEGGDVEMEDTTVDTSGYRMADQFDLSTMSPFAVAQFLDEQRKGRSDELKELLEQEREELELPEGDYNIQVHLLEISDLVLHASGAMPSPMVYVEVLGKKFHSRPIYEVTSDFFDEIFYFSMKGLTKEQLREARVKLTVVDHYWLDVLKRGWFDSIIGVYQIDLLSVYSNKDHELHRKWGTLRNPHSSNDQGRQGLVKFSVVCLGPGDKQKYHDPQKEDDDAEAEDDVDKTEGSGLVDAGMKNPTQALQFLVIGIVRVEGLPGYGRWVSTTRSGLWAYCEAEFAGCKPVKTSKVAISGHENLSITFEEELWIPVWAPNPCKRFSIAIKNKELGRTKQVIGTAYVDFDTVKKYEEDPIEAGGSLFSGYKGKFQGEMLKLIHFYGANPVVRTGTKDAQFMNKYPNYGSSYRGTMLASIRVVKHSPQSDAAHKQVMSYSIPEELMPPYASYNLKAFCFQGSDFGSHGKHAQSGSGILWSDNYSVSISIGQHEAATGFKSYSDGSVDWLELCEAPDLILPRDMSSLPDTFITVYKGAPSSYTSVAFLRIPTIELLASGTKSTPIWYDLKHDQSHKSTPTVGFPGSVLLRISLVNTQDIGMIGEWDTDRKRMSSKKPYALWCNVYQARGLPSVNKNGLIDPYVKARFGGTKLKTKTIRNSQNPVFFQTLEFAKEIPEDMRLAPNLLLQVWDSNLITGFPIGAMRVQLKDVKVSQNVNYNPDQVPEWCPLVGIDGKGNMGEVLCSFLLIELKKLDQNIPPPRPIEPPLRKAYLDIHLIGLRNLVKRGYSNIRNPYLQLDLVSTGYGDSIKTSPSRLPMPTNPNYLERQIVSVDIPDDPLYCPALEVQVWDQRTLDRIMLGVITIDLRTKLPWNGSEFIPPRQHAILTEAKEAKQRLKEAKAKKAKEKAAKQRGLKDAALAKLKGDGDGDGTNNPLLNTRSDGFDASDEDDEEEELFLLPDEGAGVFPPEPGSKELGSQYATLPPIADADEEEEAKRRRMAAYLKENKQELSGAIPVDDRSEKAALAKAIGFPVSWTAQNFMQDRDWWMLSKSSGEGGQLEDYMQTYAFEHYDIVRGHLAFNKYDKRKSTLKKVGQLKAVIRVTMKNPRMDEEYNNFARSYRVPEKVVVRVYVIKAQNLLPMDIFGSADPYLKVQLGDVEHRDKKTLQKRTLTPDFFAAYEFNTTMSGPGQLKVGLWDKNLITSDQVIGETVVDLEDRWFHPKWNELEKKPAEIRTLYKPGQLTSQGLLTMWVDIFTQEEATMQENRMIMIQGPEKKEYQLRIVTWRSVDVPDLDGGASDLFLQFSMQGSDKKYRTDTHWRCKKGLGSWNYRTLIQLELPMRKREEGRLTIEMMERNIVTSNTLVGSHMYNLYDWLMLAYRRQSSVFPLKEKKEVLKKIARQREKMANFSGDATTDEGLDDNDEDDSDLDPDADGDGDGEGGMIDGDDGDSVDGDEPLESEPMLPVKSSTTYGSAPSVATVASPLKGGGAYGNKEGGEKKEGGEGGQGEEAQEDEEEESNIDALFNQVNVMLGVGEAVADDADWFSLSTKDYDTGAEVYSGRIALSLSLVPKEEYENDPVGKARDEPNKDPYLPPPNGRLSFTLNPLAILKELCSPRVICCIVCCLVCMVLVTAMIFISSQLSGLVAFYSLFSGS
jgi:hypothetical protein